MSARDQIYTHLQAALLRVLGEAIQGVDLFPKGELSLQRFQKPRMRVQVLLRQLTDQAKEATAQADQSALTEIEINRCSALIACAFLDPYKVLWDSDCFAEASKKRRTGKYFGETHLGIFAKPATIVDMQGKILAWYLPGLLLSHQIALLNGATQSIKDTVLNSLNKQTTSWRTKGYVIPDEYDEPSKAYFGASKLSISLGTFMTGHMRLEDQITPSATLKLPQVQTWLQTIQPVELLLDATLQIIHPDFWHATFTASQALAQQLQFPIPCWPSVYTAMDLIINRSTPAHLDAGGALSFYDLLLSLGDDNGAMFCLNDIDTQLDYSPGSAVFFTGSVLKHSVSDWTGGERVAIAHYSKDLILDRLGIARPILPTQLSFWDKFAK
ncbi:hypothetical protein JOM56_011039 [Amanita muscaria]